MNHPIISSTPDKFLLTKGNGTIPFSSLLLPELGIVRPIVQALNMGHLPYPLPAVLHSECVSPELNLVNFPLEQLQTLQIDPTSLGKPVAVIAKYWYHLYGFSEGPVGEWVYDWKLEQGLPIKQRDEGKFSINHTQAQAMVTDLHSIYLCIKDIQNHLAFVWETLLPSLLNSTPLFWTDFSLEQQIHAIIGLAQISFCMGMAFINSWCVAVGPGWCYNIPSKRMNFLWHFDLCNLPLWGGVFNLDHLLDYHLLNGYLKNNGPVIIIYPSRNHLQKCRFTRVEHNTITQHHTFNTVNSVLLNWNLKFCKIFDLVPFIMKFWPRILRYKLSNLSIWRLNQPRSTQAQKSS